MMYLVTDSQGRRSLINSSRIDEATYVDPGHVRLFFESGEIRLTIDEFNRLLDAMRQREGVVDLNAKPSDLTPEEKMYIIIDHELRSFSDGEDARKEIVEQMDVLWNRFSPEQKQRLKRKG